MIPGLIFIILACVFGLVMTWGVGANDLANVMSTSMGSKAITVRQAMIIATVFEFAGGFLGSGRVSETIRSGIINTQTLTHTPEIMIYGMLSVLLAGMVWILLASFLGLPVSITNAIVGAIVGFGTIVLGVNAIDWRQVSFIALSWISSPILAGIVAYLLFRSIQLFILVRRDPQEKAQRYAPIYLFLVGVVLSFMTVVKGLKHFNVQLNSLKDTGVALGCGILVVILGMICIARLRLEDNIDRHTQFQNVEKIFAILMAFTACAMVFAHGSNDVAIAVGPMAVVINIVLHGSVTNTHPFPTWITFLGCSGVILGLFMYGRKVIATVGSGITALTPSRAFAATLAAATTVVVSTGTGIPVSATQTLVGSVFGVGLARGIGALNLTVIRNILLSWVITLPMASLLAIIFYAGFKFIFSL